MMPLVSESSASTAGDYELIERAIAFIESRFTEQPNLETVALALGVSPFHLQRMFTRWAGVSPKRFLQAVTLRHAKPLLEGARNILDATYEVGLSSPSRLHDLFVTCEATTPGDYKARGKGIALRYGIHPTPFGQAVIGLTPKGICELSFFTRAEQQEETLQRLHEQWQHATLTRDDAATAPIIARIFHLSKSKGPLPLHLHGSNFQLKVWQALLRIPSGSLVAYEDIAASIGSPKAVRAVGSAVGSNPVAWLIPCHRVLRKSGAIGGYATGTPRKRAMLALELPIEDEI